MNTDRRFEMNFVRKLCPFLDWFPMTGAQVRADLLAGITVALVLVPQSMAYAQLAGLPAYHGLYAAFLPVVVGALWGSSRQLATGPVAIAALLTASTLVPLAAPGSKAFVELAILLAFLVGVVRLALGLLRLGVIVNLLSHPVMLGFTNAAAIVILLSQLGTLLGVPMPRSDSYLADVAGVLRQIADAHWPSLAMGLAAFALMIVLRRFLPRWPNVLIAVALTALVSWQIGFERNLKVDVSALQDPAAVARISEYLQTSARLSERQDEVIRSREAVRATADGSREQRAAAQYALDVAIARADEAERERRAQLDALRALRWVAVRGDDGAIRLVSVESAPGAGDGTVWRIRRVDASGVHLAGGGDVVGAIPPGLPSLTLPSAGWSEISNLLSGALVIALLGFMEAISIAKAMAAKTRQRLDPNQELIGQGLANFASAASQGFPVGGSFSRSAINLNAGAVTGMSSVFTALVVLATLLWLTPWLYHVPQAVLAAVIMMAVVGLINFPALAHAWRAHRDDGIAAVTTLVGTLAFAPRLERGLALGALVSVILYLRRRMRPRVAIMGRHADGALAGIDAHGLPPLSSAFVPVRFDGDLTFLNVAYFEDMILEVMARFPRARALLLIGSSINEIDTSGEEKLREIAQRLARQGIELYISGLKKPVQEALERAHIFDAIAPDRFFRTNEQAVDELLARYAPEREPQAVSPRGTQRP